jgi:hypothetical protein
MEYYPLHPGTYGITLEDFNPAITSKEASRKRPRDEDSGDAGRSNGHDGSASSSSAAVDRPGITGQGIGEPGEVNRNREVTQIPSSTSNAASRISSTVAPASSRTDSDEAKRLERRAAREQQRKDKQKRTRRENIAKQVGHEVDSDEERQYWQESLARHRAEAARREALSPEVSSAFQNVIKEDCSSCLADDRLLDCIALFLLYVRSASGIISDQVE